VIILPTKYIQTPSWAVSPWGKKGFIYFSIERPELIRRLKELGAKKISKNKWVFKDVIITYEEPTIGSGWGNVIVRATTKLTDAQKVARMIFGRKPRYRRRRLC
jgi:hypothetical protein